MKYLAVLLLPAVLLLGATALQFDVRDARGKRASGVPVEAGDPDTEGWRELRLTKAKPGMLIVWPYDARVKEADGPAPVPVIVGQPGDAALRSSGEAAAAALLLGKPTTGFDSAALVKSTDELTRGVGLLLAGKQAEAAEALAIALRERERQLTRFPSEIYATAILSGKAWLAAGKYDDAAVAFLKARRQRPSDELARGLRAEALLKAGKPEAARDF